jgi:hypothetical protein
MGRRTDIVDFSLSTILRSPQQSKVKKSAQNIDNYLNGLSIPECESVLNRIVQFLVREVYSKGFEYADSLSSRIIILTNHIGKHALKKDDADYICRNFLFNPYNLNNSQEEALYRAKAAITYGLFRYFGSSLELSLNFCSIVFKALNRAEISPEDNKETTSRIFRFIVDSMCCPATSSTPQKLWFTNLVEYWSDNNEARTYLYCALSVLDHFAELKGQKRTSTIMQSARRLEEFNEDFISEHKAFWLEPGVDVCVVVPDHLYNKLRKYRDKISDRTQGDIKKSSEFIEWFNSHRDEISNVFDRKCQEIINNPRYGIRPMGYDSFLVKVTPLLCTGITSFSFYPEGERFPDVKLELTSQKDINPQLCQFWATMRNFDLNIEDEVLYNWIGLDITLLRSVLEYLIVDALHRVIVSKPKKNLAEEMIERDISREIIPDKQIKVRPFMRRLPIGFKASEDARNNAYLHLGWILPEGITFVQSHDRWVGLPIGKPAPLVEYTDEFVYQSIKEFV